jgi:hypothetical protein
MSLLTHQSFANDKTPYWLSNPVEYLRFAGTPPVDVSNSDGELFANGVSMSPATWYEYPANGVVLLDEDGDRLQIISNDLYFNNSLIATASNISNVADWYLYPALSNVELNAGVGIDFDGRLLSRSGTDLFFGGVNLNSSTWSQYPALQNVQMSNFSMSNLSGISASSNFTANVSSNYVLNARTIKNTSFSTISNECTIFDVTTDTINPLGGSKINLIANNGSGGEITLNAKSSITGSIGGKVSITADGGNTGGFVYGGLVEITANTGGALPTGFTSAIKMSAASVLSYAGAVSPFASVAGYNFVYGTAGVNLIAGVPSVLPNVPGSIFMTGDIGILGSSGGVRIKKGVSVDFITPLPLNGDLIVSGNPAGDKVQLSNVRSLGMEGDITGLGNLTMTGNIGGVSTITMSNVGAITGVNTINGFPYNPVRNWANFPAIGDVDMSGNDLNRTGQIRFVNSFPTNASGFQGARGWRGLEGDLVGTIESGSNGNFRCRELVLTYPGSYPSALGSDVKITNISNTYDSKDRVAVISATTAEVVAYVTDIPRSHGSFSSSINQSQTISNVPHIFTYNTFAGVEGMTESAGQITSTNGGTYVITFSIQFARTSGGTATIAEAWVRKNGTDVPNTNSRILLAGGGNGETIMTIPVNLDLAAGEYFEIVMGTPNYTNTIAQAFPARTTPYVAPAIPSIIVTADQVG